VETLPVLEVVPEIRQALREGNTVVLQAPPGAGKSTVLPLHLLGEPWLEGKKIIMLEPRRLAAKAVAWRLAEQLGEEPGQTVGYRIRFESKTGKSTRIEIVTEGILTRMLQHDNALGGTGLVIFDEFHERSLHSDLAFALAREAQQVLRNELRLLIMSATLDTDELRHVLKNPPLISSKGRQYPVTYRYQEPDGSLHIAQNTCRLVLKAFREEPEGDVLVFLPGSGDILRAAGLLEEAGLDAIVYPLFGDLPHDEQQRALLPDPSGRRKIILATSIAETSLTIEGVRVVVDSGYSRIPRYDLNTGLSRLETVRSTRDTADQRAGRAGRLGPGVCYRMWAEAAHHHLGAKRKPEILQADLAQLTLELAGWGHADPAAMEWVTPPPSASILQARQLLESLEALSDGRITNVGREMLDLPTHPRIAHMLIHGKRNGLGATAADVAALLEERDPLRGEGGTDLTLRLEILERWRKKERVNADRNSLERIDRIARQWRKALGAADMTQETTAPETAGALIAAAYPERIARREDTHGRYRMANGRPARLQETDPMTHEFWIAIAQLDAGTKEGKVFLSAAFDPESILKEAVAVESIAWDEKNGTLIARKEWRIGSLVAKEENLRNPAPEKVAGAVCGFISKEGLHLFDRTDASDRLQARVQSLRKWRPEEDFPDFSDEALQESAAVWASPYLGNIRRKEEIKRLDFYAILCGTLSWEQQQVIDRLAPTRMEVPSGSMIDIRYSVDGSPPVLAVRLQEVFGMTESPTVNGGRTNLLLHLLSPGFKPVQVTQDLKSFWQNTYHEVRKELRIRYPKHSWPEDPWTATAVRGAVRRKQ
jgi:ATP-dependent helicase HrpB